MFSKTFQFAMLLLFIGFMSCENAELGKGELNAIPNEDLSAWVNPFIGTGGHGHTFPGATIPFGMVQLSPDTRLEGWDGCSGYHYSDSLIYGFSHTHLSGTGVSDYGDVLLMPTNRIIFNNGSDGKEGYRAGFSHVNEEASAGYYRVELDTEIDVELTTTLRTGIHRYTYPSSENQIIILDLEHRDKLLDWKIEQTSEHTFSGYRHSKAWAKDQRLFYAISLSHPIKSLRENADEKPTKAAFELENPNNESVIVKVGISAVDEAGAIANLEMEAGGKSFDQILEDARNTWNKELSKISIQEDDTNRKTIFYSALYHTMIAPNLYSDIDGRYRGMDLEIHEGGDFDYYTVFSLWDTYRAAHPLYTIIDRKRTEDFINTMLAKYEEGGILPIWDLSANYTGCMIGYHGVSVIADAYMKGIRNFDANLALEAMLHSANSDHLGLKSYKEYGFIPVEEESESVSKTLEYAYDDWCIAHMAKAMGRDSVYDEFIARAQNYKAVYDPSTGFMRGRFRNTWFGPFDPFEVNFNYTEANAWQYSLYVPQDVSGHISLMGGNENYEAHLDGLFSAKAETAGRHQADITGLIGQYAHGNEPSHHMAYLYNFVGRTDKTQEKVHQILTELYKNSPDGISGNEDCGQMSAWYVFSALGFYPVCPGSNQYIIGSPLVGGAQIKLENGKTFEISLENGGEDQVYIKSILLNGKKLERSFLWHKEIAEGGSLVYEMTDNPTNWARDSKHVPQSEIKENRIVLPPFIQEGEVAFKHKTKVTLGHQDEKAVLYYRWNGSDAISYSEALEISESGRLSLYAERDGLKSVELSTDFYKIDPEISINLEAAYANEYSAGGDDALIDGIKGSVDFRSGAWQGYENQDVIATISLGEGRRISEISTSFLQNQGSWIFLPTEVEVSISADGETWEPLEIRKINSAKADEENSVEYLEFAFPERKVEKIRLKAKTLGPLPEWHLGYPYEGKAWIFIDEIQFK